MKKTSIFFVCMIALVAFAASAPNADAFEDYAGCAGCHGDFRASPYVSETDGQSWGDDLHDVHRRTMLSSDCNACHQPSGRSPVFLNFSTGNAATGQFAISCVGCHGRDEDFRQDIDSSVFGDRGAGLRQHHWNGGVTCLECHDDANPATFTPVGENVKPSYYFTPDAAHLAKPTEPCNPNGEEDFAGSLTGIDNDGDGVYDEFDSDCAVCTPTGELEDVCNGIDDDCDGLIDEDFAPMDTTCGVGECAGATGTESCVDGQLVDTCDPLAGASAEICDTLDNDCDGAVDEDLTQATTCGVGECAGNAGIETCVDGVFSGDTCDPLAGASAEICDTLDNDCDGAVDEDLTQATTCGVGECAGNAGIETCVDGVFSGDTCDPLAGASAEICDTLDNDCDGAVDEDLTQATTCGVGECAGNAGIETCVDGVFSGDTCDPLAGASAEICDTLDNDCDGAVDEDLTQATTCGVGECAGNAGIETCVDGVFSGDTCDPLAGASAEICDTLDNDCDGAVDEDLTQATTCGVGECAGNAGIETCVDGVFSGDTCDPLAGASAEICDTLDNDCDGAVDEDLTRATTCGQGACAGNAGIETCVDGVFSGDTCDPLAGATAETCDDGTDNDCDGFADDQDPDCAITCTPTGPEICDGLDNDCNGQVDDGIAPQNTTCGVGECAGSTGQATCQGGELVDTCDPLAGASAEICDTLDNDCDGAVDEDLTQATTCGVGECAGNAGIETCVDGVFSGDTCDPLAGASAEICDTLDNDCDGAVDEDLTQATTCGVGECAGNAGIETCVDGVFSGDTCDPLAGASAEICDTLDNDCDGAVDEDLTRATTCGQGACAGNAGIETCVDGVFSGDTCDPLAGATPETCDDGTDNDCDGFADDQDPDCAITCTPTGPEICDGLDNDCNGQVDDGIAPQNTTCGVGECAGSTGQATCQGGELVDTCDPLAGATPETCDDGNDNDCDGLTDTDDPDCQDVAPIEAEIDVPGSINGSNKGKTTVEIEIEFEMEMTAEIATLACGAEDTEDRLVQCPSDDGSGDCRVTMDDDEDEDEYTVLIRTSALELSCDDTEIICVGTLADETTFEGMDGTRVIRDFQGNKCEKERGGGDVDD